MYLKYFQLLNFDTEIHFIHETDLGGIKDISIEVKGPNVYQKLKNEIGIHRVQRVSQTESNGRMHTSSAFVMVFPLYEAKDLETTYLKDVTITYCRSGGAGGQHVNKTESAVRIVHNPTGTTVRCEQERSQKQNKERAFQILYSKLQKQQKEMQQNEIDSVRKKQIEQDYPKIRTYNFMQNRCTDHRLDKNYQLGNILSGDLEDLVKDLVNKEKEDSLQEITV